MVMFVMGEGDLDPLRPRDGGFTVALQWPLILPRLPVRGSFATLHRYDCIMYVRQPSDKAPKPTSATLSYGQSC